MATISSTSGTGSATFTASGLASGMDTASIVESLVALESRPITLLQNQQTAIKTQLSTLASIVSRLSALSTSADDLGSNGVFTTRITSTNTAFSATAGSAATAGRYAVSVEQMAQAAKWRSTGLTSGQTVAGGTLTLTVQGQPPKTVTLQDNSSLGDVAYAIRQTGLPVSAAVLNDGTRSYLSVTAQDTGYPLDKTSAAALQITYDPPRDSGGNPVPQQGVDPAFALIQEAKNATVVVDQLTFTRQSNVITDALPGVTLTLTKAAPGQTEDLVLNTDLDATQARVQKFVDAYNGVMSLLRKQLQVNKDTDRSTSLVGFGSVRSLQAALQQVLIAKVPGLANVRTLADLGLKTSKDDGSLSIDAKTFRQAATRDPAALNALFSTAGTGITAVVDKLVARNTRSVDGALTLTQDSLNQRITDMDDQIATMQTRVDAYRKQLLAQFTAMETTVSGLKTMGTYLTNWANSTSSSSSK